MKTEKNQQPKFGFINCTQKQEERMKQGDGPLSFIFNETQRASTLFQAKRSSLLPHENGITLIALIIMIILIVILAVVTLKGITGKEGILASSSNIANEYVIQQYKEQIEQLVHSIILQDSLLRKNNNNKKYGRRNGKRELDKKCNTK